MLGLIMRVCGSVAKNIEDQRERAANKAAATASVKGVATKASKPSTAKGGNPKKTGGRSKLKKVQ